MFKVNDNYLKLPGSYLFSTIGKKVAAYKAENPDRQVISLGIGDVTQPLAPAVIKAMHSAVDEMADAATFHGYAPDLGYEFLRKAIAENDYKARGVEIALDEIFISDGAKSDSGNIGDIFSVDNKIAVCDPVWKEEPVHMIKQLKNGQMLSICHVPQRQTLHRNFHRKHRISSICASRTIRPVLPSTRQNSRNGLITH